MAPSLPQLYGGVILAAAPIFATVMVGEVGAASALPQASPGPHASATPRPSKAPADEYFGQLKMSILGLRHRIDTLGKRYDDRTITDDDLIHDARLIEDGIDRWRTSYPRDPWLPLTSFHLAELYMKAQTGTARARAKAMFAYTAHYFPASHQGHLSRVRLAQGFPPLRPEAPPSPPAIPSEAPAPQPLSSEPPAPAPSASPSPG